MDNNGHNLWGIFEDYVTTELNKIDINELYNTLASKHEFCSSTIRHLFILTIYSQEFKKQTNELPPIGALLNLLSDKDELPKIMIPQLLYGLALCDRLKNKKLSQNNLYL